MLYSESDKAIFAYFDGKSEKKADPLALRRKLQQAAGGRLYELSRTASGDHDQPTAVHPDSPEALIKHDQEDFLLAQLEAEDKLLQVIRHVFEMQPLDAQTGEGRHGLDLLASMGKILGLHRGGRESGRQHADFCATYGLPAGELDYRAYVQLSLNAERIRYCRALEFALGHHAATSDEPLKAMWGEAMAGCKEEAAAVLSEVNARRADARASRKTSGGPW